MVILSENSRVDHLPELAYRDAVRDHARGIGWSRIGGAAVGITDGVDISETPD